MLRATFFGHSAVSSSSQSMTLASRPRFSMRRVEPIAAIAHTLLTTHAQYIELADEIAEDDCAVAGHDGAYYT